MSNLTAFLTGLGTGGLSCLAVQGGLLIGLLAKKELSEESRTSRWQRLLLPVGGFLIAKVLVYTILGFLLGAIGAKLQLTTTALVWLQSFAAVFMVVTGIRLIWPQWLPWLAITPPASVRRMVRKSAKSELLVAPIILGALTVLIPCGTTLAMEASALATGNPLRASGILFYFIIGTVPLFFIIGILAKGTNLLQNKLKYVTALLVICTGLYSFNAVLNMIDSPYSFRNEMKSLNYALSSTPATNQKSDTHPTIIVSTTGYDPDTVTVPAGQPVTLTFNAPGKLSCTSLLRIPKLGIEKTLTLSSSTDIQATFPTAGSYTFTCGMGMFSGTITAI